MSQLAVVLTRAEFGVQAPQVRVEVHLSPGLPNLNIVGLPETAVKESKDRVRAAIMNSGYDFPQRRITINLSPADIPKQGGRYDLPIAVGVLAASGQLRLDRLRDVELLGELALGGALRPVRGILPVVSAVAATGRSLIAPVDNGVEAALVQSCDCMLAKHLLDVCNWFDAVDDLPRATLPAMTVAAPGADLADVKGQEQAKRALIIAAASQHSLLILCSIKYANMSTSSHSFAD